MDRHRQIFAKFSPIDYVEYEDHNSLMWSPIQYLAKGVFPAFILDDLRSMCITSNLGAICSGLLKNAINAFREFIWKPRCTKNVDREKRLEITKAEKRFRSPSRTN